jgi:glutamine amidotransferase
MFAYVGSSHEDINQLYEELKKAAECDNTRSTGITKHSDGWGFVIFTGMKLLHYRTHIPIFKDKFKLPEINGKTYAIFHARGASPISPKGSPLFSHPFVATNNWQMVFLAHNGSMKKEVMQELQQNSIDSEFALNKIIENGNLNSAIKELKEKTETALNLLVLTFDKKEYNPKLEYFNYWKKENEDAFYQMYKKEFKHGKAVFSSTMNQKIKGKPCAFDEIINIEV